MIFDSLSIRVVNTCALDGVHEQSDVKRELRLNTGQLRLNGLQLLSLVVGLLLPEKGNLIRQTEAVSKIYLSFCHRAVG